MKTHTIITKTFFEKLAITRPFKVLSLLLIAATLLPASCKKDKKEPAVSLMVSTLAGTGFTTPEANNGPAKDATFNLPAGVAITKEGIVYVADTHNNQIRKITKEGEVSTLAGGGTELFADCKGFQAKFDQPCGIAVDAQGNIYVADRYNNRIRKITLQLNGPVIVSTLAGDGTQNFKDNTTGLLAQFDHPAGIAVDAQGIVYVADSGNNRIRKITQTNGVMVTTLAGGNGIFKGPEGVAVDAQGNVYVGDTYNYRIQKITTEAGIVTVSTLAGSGDANYLDATGTAAKFYRPEGIAVDAQGNVYVADSYNHRIRKITKEGVVSTLAGTGYRPNPVEPGIGAFLDGKASVAQFNQPHGVAVGADGKVYVADRNNHRIRKIE
ncbi:MAG: NHL repeat-containing protein [Daejeonella sp.]